MRTVIPSILMVFSLSVAVAQPTPIESAFDFWVGDWDLHWFVDDTVRVEGTNYIEKILGGQVLQENFDDPTHNFMGTSISVYRPSDSTWRQAWADNQGGYFDFIGEIDGETRIFKSHIGPPGQDSLIQRMRFYNITADSFTWDWEGTRDDGRNWKLLWRIFYERHQEPEGMDE